MKKTEILRYGAGQMHHVNIRCRRYSIATERLSLIRFTAGETLIAVAMEIRKALDEVMTGRSLN